MAGVPPALQARLHERFLDDPRSFGENGEEDNAICCLFFTVTHVDPWVVVPGFHGITLYLYNGGYHAMILLLSVCVLSQRFQHPDIFFQSIIPIIPMGSILVVNIWPIWGASHDRLARGEPPSSYPPLLWSTPVGARRLRGFRAKAPPLATGTASTHNISGMTAYQGYSRGDSRATPCPWDTHFQFSIKTLHFKRDHHCARISLQVGRMPRTGGYVSEIAEIEQLGLGMCRNNFLRSIACVTWLRRRIQEIK